jgi:hypothetical protein
MPQLGEIILPKAYFIIKLWMSCIIYRMAVCHTAHCTVPVTHRPDSRLIGSCSPMLLPSMGRRSDCTLLAWEKIKTPNSKYGFYWMCTAFAKVLFWALFTIPEDIHWIWVLSMKNTQPWDVLCLLQALQNKCRDRKERNLVNLRFLKESCGVSCPLGLHGDGEL